MRTVELAKVAAAAEALRLRRMVHRQSMRGVYGAVAAVFAIAAFVLLHVIAYELLVLNLSPVISALIILVFDLVVAGILGVLALRNTPDAVEVEALAVRKNALIELRKSATTMSLAGQVGALVLRRRVTTATAPRAAKSWLFGQIANRLLTRR